MSKVERVELNLFVPSIEDTAAWYQRVLGWKYECDATDSEGHCTFGSVSYSQDPFLGMNLIRSTAKGYSNECSNFTVFIKVDDLDQINRGLISAGVTPESGPREEGWGAKTLSLRDCNRFLLTFWQEM